MFEKTYRSLYFYKCDGNQMMIEKLFNGNHMMIEKPFNGNHKMIENHEMETTR